MRRISAHCSTSTNDLLLARPQQRITRLHARPDTDAPTAQGVHFQPARGGEYSGGADNWHLIAELLYLVRIAALDFAPEARPWL